MQRVYTFNILEVHRVVLHKMPETPHSFQQCNSCFPHITQFPFQYYCDMNLHDKAQHNPCPYWSDKGSGGFNNYDDRTHLLRIFVIFGVTIKPSTIKHPSVRLVWIKTQDSRKGEPVEYYHGSILYRAMSYGTQVDDTGEDLWRLVQRTLKNGLFTSCA